MVLNRNGAWMTQEAKLTDLIDDIASSGEGEKIAVRDMLDAIQDRGFGPLIAVCGLLAAPPIGALPGAPAIIGIVIALVAIQLVFGRKTPWLPQWILNLSFKREKFEKARPKIERVTQAIDKAIKPRLSFLASEGSSRFVALICVGLGASMPFIGFLPFAALAPALAVLFFGIGLSAKDGVVILIGYFAVALTIWVAVVGL